ncbi:MAG: RDD family protein [Candidatus Dormibacteraeota bacterium]|nr:RDD family protein [Candidatus Dormibacteraeota bacterium]MBV8446185.1 RDD family protein [Candidatus Dormibacteraeota bacterium]
MSMQPPDTIRVLTADNVRLGYSTAGVGSRMVAQIIDNLVALALTLVAVVAGLAIASHATTATGSLYGALAGVGIALFVYFAYFAISELISGGRTLGKAAMGLRVLRADGSTADVGAILVRNVVRLIDVVGGIGLVVMFFHPLSRRLGDLAGGTVVVRERTGLSLSAAVASPPVILRTPDPGPPIDGIGLLGAHEHNAVRAFLARQGLQPAVRMRLAADISHRLFDRMQLPPSAPERMWPPELFLERLYLQLELRGR